ncbi:MAG: Tfx family DNA-binding protein [ANME-2 cluster archaeon]|nr:Tfx family DNA-binding protein [ANME-2 cluster archaeon]
MPNNNSFLTIRQKRVLELRMKGYTQDRIAKMLNTSRVNVSVIEKRAYQNIEKAKATLVEWEHLQALVSITIVQDTDVMSIPRIIFNEADRAGIKMHGNTLDIITQIHETMPGVIEHRRVKRSFVIFISRTGEVSFE